MCNHMHPYMILTRTLTLVIRNHMQAGDVALSIRVLITCTKSHHMHPCIVLTYMLTCLISNHMQAGDVPLPFRVLHLPFRVLHLPMAFNDYMHNEESHASVHYSHMRPYLHFK